MIDDDGEERYEARQGPLTPHVDEERGRRSTDKSRTIWSINLGKEEMRGQVTSSPSHGWWAED